MVLLLVIDNKIGVKVDDTAITATTGQQNVPIMRESLRHPFRHRAYVMLLFMQDRIKLAAFEIKCDRFRADKSRIIEDDRHFPRPIEHET